MQVKRAYGRRKFWLSAMALLGSLPPMLRAQCRPRLMQKIHEPIPREAGYFGGGVVIRGDLAVVGAPDTRDNGLAYVLHRHGGIWEFEKCIEPGDDQRGSDFGNFLALDHETLMLAAPFVGMGQRGVFHYDRESGDWPRRSLILYADRPVSRFFGVSIALSDDVVVISDNWNDEVADNAGAAFVYRFDGSSWNYETTLHASDAGANDWFGYPVVIEGDVIAIGARGDDDNGDFRGAAYVFRYDGSEWIEESKVVAFDGGPHISNFGNAIALHDDVLFVGAYYDDERGFRAGAAYVYRFDGEEWVSEQKLLPPEGSDQEWFGITVGVDDDRAVVGTGGDSNSSLFPYGAVFVYHYDGHSWIEDDILIPPGGTRGSRFGSDLSLSGQTLFVGAALDDQLERSAGLVYVYDLNCLEECLGLEVDNLVAGEMAEFTVWNGTPGARGVVIAGLGGEPTVFVDVNDWCATFGFDVRMHQQRIAVAFSGIFDANGELHRERVVRSNLQGVRLLFQAAERGTCPDECMSNIVERIVQ